MSKILVLNPFTLDPDVHALTHSLACEDLSLTVQADAEQSDINYIVRQFGVTKELPYGNDVPAYGDFSDAPNDYHQALNFIRASDDAFMELPASLRSRFENDAGSFLDFLADDNNYPEAISLGLVPPRADVTELAPSTSAEESKA